ncbi:Hemin transport protein [Pseudoxanthomonas wuyuanensis]
MAGVLRAGAFDAVATATAGMPSPQLLVALGTVLCLYRPQHGGELAGWGQSVRAEVRAGVDSDGLRESLLFFDGEGRCCWRLCLLPDSDFLAWDRLLATLPPSRETPIAAGIGERLWRRLAGRLLGEQWSASALRLHLLHNPAGPWALAASPARVSPLGAATARRILQAEGAEGELQVDHCCCAGAAARAASAQTTSIPTPDAGDAGAWIILNQRKQP